MKTPVASILVLSLCVAASGAARAGTVIINEIHYAPSSRTSPEEFVELHNFGAAPADLSGWFFSSGIEFTFAPGISIPAGGYLAVARDPAAVRARFGAAVAVVGPFEGRLDNDGETIALRNRDGLKEDQVDYQRGFPWPTAGGPQGYSIELINPGLDNDLGGSWRISNPASSESLALLRDGEVWRYRKGTAEASTPAGAWRAAGFNDASWSSGALPIGYGEGFIRTSLSDMRNTYSSVFLRKTFEVPDPGQVAGLVLDVLYDDGFNAWVNGVFVAGDNVPGAQIAYNATASTSLEDLEFNAFPLPRPSGYLVPGVNVLAVQLFNSSLTNSSDAFFDARLTVSTGAGAGPTPGARNSIHAENAPPLLRQVEHSPRQPLSNDPVTVTVKATDDDGVAELTLEYQVVDPGAYIALDDAEYETSWTPLAMHDDGLAGDAIGGDEVWTAVLPRVLQGHRTLIRYRLRALDGAGFEVRVPYADDPQPNFAYFVYDGVPDWAGAIEPGSADAGRRQAVEYPLQVMRSLPVYHLITKQSSTEDCTWNSKYGGENYLWLGTLVYDGDVYDHVRFRARGGVWRYAMGKNMWKFDFLRGHEFQARDDFGRGYRTRWDKLNFSALIQQGDYLHRGEQGLFESTGFKMFNLAGVEAPKTHFVQFRIIDEADEFGLTQYQGDFWGLYLAIEQMDGRFLDEHGFPDGNLYKMESGTGELNNQGPTGATDKSDLNAFLDAYENTTPTDAWWRQNLNLERYYGYRAIVEAIHHYDIGYGKNYFYYLNPDDGRWEVLPWDIDLIWADNMFGNGDEPFRSRVLSRAAFSVEYRNRLREIRDLLYNPEQTGQLIDEFAAIVDPPGQALAMVDADRSMWDYNPIMVNASIVNLSKAGHGRFYQRAADRTFRGMAQLMKNYINSRGSWIDSNLLIDAAIPRRPTAAYAGPAGFPVDGLRFSAGAFSDPQGANTFSALAWRIGEVAPAGAPAFDAARPRPYEIAAVWESGELASFQSDVDVPPHALRPGARYRARVRMKDSSGRWSQWSPAVEFTAGAPSAPFPQQTSLRITELHFHPLEDDDFEFVEIQNIGAGPVDLAAVAFTEGIEFRFGDGAVPSLPPGDFVLVVKNLATFRTRYEDAGLLIAGEYSGRLENAGERVILAYGNGNAIHDFAYSDAWYPLADGAGHSLVAADPLAPASAWTDAAGWAESSEIHGSPGRADGGGPLGGLQRPGDGNQDGLLDISDSIFLLRLLFAGGAALPCDGGIESGGNRALLDVNSDAAVNVADAIFALSYLFKDGPAPAAGTRCVRIEGCPSACRLQ